MADKLLGQQLYATGWRQGTLLSTHYPPFSFTRLQTLQCPDCLYR